MSKLDKLKQAEQLYVSEKQLLDVIGAKTRPFKQELFLYLWNG